MKYPKMTKEEVEIKIKNDTQAGELWNYYLKNYRKLIHDLEQLWFQTSIAYEETPNYIIRILIISIIHM